MNKRPKLRRAKGFLSVGIWVVATVRCPVSVEVTDGHGLRSTLGESHSRPSLTERTRMRSNEKAL